MKLFVFVVVIYSVLNQRHPDQFEINLDLLPRDRYKQISIRKKQYINKFIEFLYTTQKYRTAFKTAKYLSPFLRRLVGSQFYQQCQGIATSVGRHISELIVFNYMYQLGAYSKFCTSIPVQLGPNDYFLARNLDYGFQQFLANNSVKLTFIRNKRPIYQTIGHAGLIGAHTGLRYDGYSVTLNERIEKGLHVTIEQIFIRKAETVPYLVQKTLRSSNTLQEAEKKLMNTKICSAAYYILNGPNKNIIIERQRTGIKAFFRNDKYMVQTNTDRDQNDPDRRRDIAELKMNKINESNSISRQNVWNILLQSPNMNNLTLITVLLDTSRNYINATVWY